MGIKIRIGGIGIGSGKSSYWTPQSLSSLLVVTESATTQNLSVVFTTDKEDGVSWEYSTDGVNYTQHGTTPANVKTYNATGLTKDTKYYWKARLFKGSKYGSYTNVDSDVTLISAWSDIAVPINLYDSENYTEVSGKVDTLVDLGSANKTLIATGADNRPIRTAASLNGLAKITFDGVKNRLLTGAYTFNQPYTSICLIKFVTKPVRDQAFAGSIASSFTALIELPDGVQLRNYAGTATAYAREQGTPKNKVFTAVMNGAGSFIDDNGVKFTGNPGTYGIAGGLCLGAYANADGVCANIEFYEWAVFSGALTDAQITKGINFLSAKYAEDYGINERNDNLFDNSLNKNLTDFNAVEYEKRNEYSEFSFNTSDSSIKITANPKINDTFPGVARIAVYEDDVHLKDETISTFAEKTVTLSNGTKKVTLIECQATNVLAGTHLTSIKVKNFTKVNKGNIATKMVFIGDSIVSGGNVGYPERQAFSRLFKYTDGIDQAFYAWGYATLQLMAGSAGLITTTVGYIQNLFANCTTTKILVITIGTNDAGINSTAHATFAGWYGSLLDAIHTADSSIVIYCLSPLNRNDAVDAAYLVDYRTDIDTLCAARSAYATHIDGNGIINVATDLDDTVHPNIAGHLKVYNALKAVIFP